MSVHLTIVLLQGLPIEGMHHYTAMPGTQKAALARVMEEVS
jgi:hypothetical protein